MFTFASSIQILCKYGSTIPSAKMRVRERERYIWFIGVNKINSQDLPDVLAMVATVLIHSASSAFTYIVRLAKTQFLIGFMVDRHKTKRNDVGLEW